MHVNPLILFTCGVVAGVMALPVPALALGLGKLSVQSGLGQPLSARIELTAAQKDELDSVAARVAEPSVYRENNVHYSPAVSRARVSVEQGANNTAYLRVSTPQAVNDPYLDLIVEVNWATGRVVRNYTFLLDPPGAGETQAVEPVTPIRAAAAPASAAPPSAAPPPRPTAAAAATPSAINPPGASVTYTVKRGDTLSKIANERKPEDVTLEQMLVALHRSNEAAFEDRNMNRLRSGQILTIPPRDQVAAVPPTEASQVVKLQAADWRTYRDRVAAGAPASEGTAGRQAAGGKIGTAAEDKAAAAQPGKDQLRVAREAGKSAAAAGAAQAEDVAARENALREASARVAELEKTLKDLQKAVELKSQTLAELQRQADASKAAKAAETPKSAAQAEAPKPEPAKTEPPKAATPPLAAAPEAKAPETKAPAAPPTETRAAEGKTAAPSVPPVTMPKPAPKSEPSFFDDLFANAPTWAVGGGALVILGGIAAIIAARRGKTTKFEDSILSGTDIKTNTVFGSTGGGVINTGDNSLASDFSREGLGNIDTDEVDPIAEAEVYLAYGRDAQAEEILKDALKKDPQRQDVYLKLLEIHAQHNKPSAFETVASELYSVSGGQGETWQKAMVLGRQLDPSNPLFTEAGSAAAFAAVAAAESEAAAQERAEPAASDTQVFSVPPDLKPEPKPQPRDKHALDFTFDDDVSVPPAASTTPKSPAAILAGAEEEVAKSTRHPGDGEAAEKSAAAAATKSGGEKAGASVRDSVSFEAESIPRFDLDFNLDEPSRPMAPMPAAPKPAAAKPSAPPEPELTPVAASALAPQLKRPPAAIELDKLDLAFDPQRSTFEDPTPSVLDGQWHDAATKLDLAKAYQEMGDVEGAREILQEVLHEGDDQQKTEAQSLLSKLA